MFMVRPQIFEYEQGMKALISFSRNKLTRLWVKKIDLKKMFTQQIEEYED